MRLVHIEAQGLHAGGIPQIERAINSPIVVVTGPNECGKTTMIGIADMVLAGPSGAKWPVLGTSPTYDFAASARFEHEGRRVLVGRGIERATHYASLDGRPGKLKEVQGRIDAAFGSARTFQLGDFCGMTPAKRLEWLEARVLDSGGWDLDRLNQELARDDLAGKLEALGVTVCSGSDARTSLVAMIETARAAWLDADREVKRLDAALAQQRSEAAAADLPSGTVALWRGRIEELQAERAQLVERRGRIQGVKDALAAHRRALDETAKAIEETRGRIGASEAEIATVRGTLPELQVAVEMAEAVVKPLADLATVAQQKARTEGAAYKAACENGSKPADVQAMASDLLRKIDADIKAFSGEAGRQAAWKALIDLATAAASLPNRAALEAADAAHSAAKAAFQDTERARQDALRAVERARKSLDDQEKRLTRLREDLARQERQAADLQAAHLDSESSGEGGVMEALGAVQQAIADAQAKADRLSDDASDKVRKMERQMERDRSEQRRTDLRAAGKALSAVLERLLADVIVPFVAPISEITRAVVDCDCYCDLAGGFEFGCLRPDGVRIPWSTCSESQQGVLLLAFALAVQVRLGGWRRIILDGLECLDVDRRSRFLIAMRRAVDAGRLDTLICACVEDGWLVPVEVGAQIVRLERP